MMAWINQMSQQAKPDWSAPFYNPEIGSRAVIYAYPFNYKHNESEIHTVIYCSVSLDRHFRNLKNHKMLKEGFAILLNERNQIVYHPDSSETGNSLSPVIRQFKKDQLDVRKILDNRISGFKLIRSTNLKSNRAVAIYWPLKSSGWFILTVIPEKFLMSGLKRSTIFLISLILFIISIISALIIFDLISLVSPISYLAKNSREIVEDSDFNADVTPDGPKILSSSDTIWRLSQKYPKSPLNDIQVLYNNMEKIKYRLASYRKNTLKNTLDKEELDKELKLAWDIEMEMVPTSFPLITDRRDFDCFGRLIPAKIVGGDLFNIFLLDDNQLFIFIVDTLGKGIPAAMYTLMIRTLIRSIANPITRVGKIMEYLNDTLGLVQESDMFATILMGKLDLTTGEFVYCNAGHLHPIVLRNDNQEEILTQSHGIPVGVKRNLQYAESQIILASGESLITFTDGVIEQPDDQGEFFGVERLISAVRSFREFPVMDIVDKTLDTLENFRGLAEVRDDITFVMLKFIGK